MCEFRFGSYQISGWLIVLSTKITTNLVGLESY